MRRSGQFTVIEQVILFGLGVTIATGFLVAFQDFGADVKERSLQEQSQALAGVVSVNTVELIQTGATGQETFQIPPSIAGEDYFIRFSQEGVTVATSNVSATVGVAGLTERYNFTGSASNDFQTATVTKQSGRIRIEGG